MEQKKIAGETATEFIKDGMIIGIGTGTTAFYLIKKVGELVSLGMNVKAVATSKNTEKLVRSLVCRYNLPLNQS